jgi:hypothetical protein
MTVMVWVHLFIFFDTMSHSSPFISSLLLKSIKFKLITIISERELFCDL